MKNRICLKPSNYRCIENDVEEIEIKNHGESGIITQRRHIAEFVEYIKSILNSIDLAERIGNGDSKRYSRKTLGIQL